MPRQKTTGQTKLASDLGTPEIGLRHTIRIEAAENRIGSVRVRVVDGNTLDRLYLAEKISEDQYNSGTRLGGDFAKAGSKGGSLSAMKGSTQKGGVQGGRFLFAATRISEAMDFVQKQEGKGAARLLIRVVTDEIDALDFDSLTALQKSLDSLTIYYESKTSSPSSLRRSRS